MTSNSINQKLGQKEIVELIPHRHPFLWIDTVEIIEPGKWAKGIKAVKINESIFQGHFPQKPILPGVLIAEALAQVGAVLLNHAARMSQHDSLKKKVVLPSKSSTTDFSNKYGYLGRVDLKFLHPVIPEQSMVLDVKIVSRIHNFFLLKCIALVDEKRVAEGKISIAQAPGEGE